MYRLIEADHYVNKKILVVGGGDSAIEAAMGLAHIRVAIRSRFPTGKNASAASKNGMQNVSKSA